MSKLSEKDILNVIAYNVGGGPVLVDLKISSLLFLQLVPVFAEERPEDHKPKKRMIPSDCKLIPTA